MSGIDFEAGTVAIIEQLLEKSKGGSPVGLSKSEAGHRVVSLPAFMRDGLTIHLAERSLVPGFGGSMEARALRWVVPFGA